MAVSLLPKIFFAFTVLKCDWGWAKMIRTVVFCLLNYLFSIYSVSTSNTLRPCPNSGTWIPVLSLTSCWTGTGLQDKGSTKPCCLGLGSGPGVHRACLEPSLQRPLRLLLTWPLRVPCTWLASQLGLQVAATSPQCCSPSLCCSTVPRLWGHSLHLGHPRLSTQPPPHSCCLTASILSNYIPTLK